MHIKHPALVVLLTFLCHPFLCQNSAAAIPGAESLAGLITKQFDTNNDTILDQGEWQTGLEQSFSEMDSNGDVSISAADLDALAKPIGRETGEFTAGLVTVLIKKVVLTMDTDKDGSVSLKEYNAQAAAIFTKLDTSKNGSIEQSELLELPVKLIGA